MSDVLCPSCRFSLARPRSPHQCSCWRGPDCTYRHTHTPQDSWLSSMELPRGNSVNCVSVCRRKPLKTEQWWLSLYFNHALQSSSTRCRLFRGNPGSAPLGCVCYTAEHNLIDCSLSANGSKHLHQQQLNKQMPMDDSESHGCSCPSWLSEVLCIRTNTFPYLLAWRTVIISQHYIFQFSV